MDKLAIFTSYKVSQNNKTFLSESTIAKLKALGINPEEVSSETEAKKIIAEEEAKKKAEKTDNLNETKSTSQEEKLYERIKNLAQKIGINVNQNENINSIFSRIEAKFSEIKENSYNSNFNILKSEFEMIQQQFKDITSGESSILSAMDMISQNNRSTLGI